MKPFDVVLLVAFFAFFLTAMYFGVRENHPEWFKPKPTRPRHRLYKDMGSKETLILKVRPGYRVKLHSMTELAALYRDWLEIDLMNDQNHPHPEWRSTGNKIYAHVMWVWDGLFEGARYMRRTLKVTEFEEIALLCIHLTQSSLKGGK